MLISAFFRCVHIPVNMDRFFLDLLFINIEKLHRVFLHAHDLFILDKINIACILQDSRNIRCDDASGLRMPYDQRAVLAHRVQFIREIFENDSQRI